MFKGLTGKTIRTRTFFNAFQPRKLKTNSGFSLSKYVLHIFNLKYTWFRECYPFELDLNWCTDFAEQLIVVNIRGINFLLNGWIFDILDIKICSVFLFYFNIFTCLLHLPYRCMTITNLPEQTIWRCIDGILRSQKMFYVPRSSYNRSKSSLLVLEALGVM